MAAVTDRTAVIGAELCQDKALTKTLLERQGIPVPPGSSVRCWEEALQAARKLGFPVAVKPQSGQQGRGVSTQVASAQELRRAFAWAQQQGETVLIEEQVDGPAYRVLVVQGQVVAASLRNPPGVEGDGIRSIHELVAQANADPRRCPGHQGPLSLIPEDEGLETALAHQGLSLQTVPGLGKKVLLRDTANLSSGGEAEDVTDSLGPDFIEDMVRAQRAVGLDIAGIDVITPDLGRSLEEAGGRVIEGAGVVPDLVGGGWRTSRDLRVNYLVAAVRD
jgi:cyanophycin synthetase